MTNNSSKCINCFFLGTEYGCKENRKIECYNPMSYCYSHSINPRQKFNEQTQTWELYDERTCFFKNPNPIKYKDAFYYIRYPNRIPEIMRMTKKLKIMVEGLWKHFYQQAK